MAQGLDIVLLVLDTHRLDRLSCYGYPVQTTPNIDQFARKATRFTWAIAPAQWTLPVHASMFTGLYPSEHKMTQIDSSLSASSKTIAERLRLAGYFTAAFSNNPFIGALQNGLQRGFDQVTNYSYMGSGLWTADFAPVPTSNPSKKYRRLWRRKLAKMLGYTQDDAPGLLTPIFNRFMKNVLKFMGGSKTYNAQKSLNNAAQLLIRRQPLSTSQPAFIFINLMGTHSPYSPPEWALEQYVFPKFGKKSATHFINRANKISLNVDNWAYCAPSFLQEYQSLVSAMYDAEVAAQDQLVGQFFNTLRRNGQLEKTFVIVVADHGEHLGDKLRMNHMVGAYNALVHVPLLIFDPQERLPMTGTVDVSISIRRLFHTIMTVAGSTSSEEEPLSLTQCDQHLQSPEPVFVEADTPRWVAERIRITTSDVCPFTSHAVYHQGYKLITTDHTPPELYKWVGDPVEKNDLSLKLPEKALALQDKIDSFKQSFRSTTTGVVDVQYDPKIIEHLRSLGYLN